MGNAANSIEGCSCSLAAVAQQHRHPIQLPYVHLTTIAQLVTPVGKHKQRHWWQWMGFKLLVSAEHDGDGKMKRSQLHHFDLSCAVRLDQVDANVRVTSAITLQKRREEACNCLRCTADAQHTGFAPAQRLRARKNGIRLGHKCSAVP